MQGNILRAGQPASLQVLIPLGPQNPGYKESAYF